MIPVTFILRKSILPEVRRRKMKRRGVLYNIIVFWVIICSVGMVTMTSAATVREQETTAAGKETSAVVTEQGASTATEQGTTAAAANQNIKKPLRKKVKKGKQLQKKGKFVEKKGNTYYKQGRKYVKSKFLKLGKRTYFFDKNGVMTKGWIKRKGNYYYFNRSNGKMAKNRRVDGVYIGKDGKAKNKDEYMKKIQTMIKARKQMEKLCKPSDTKKEKLRKCFDWVAKAPYKRYRFLKSIYKKKGWEVDFANDIFDHGDGCCVSEAAALAFLVHECGYKTVYVAHDTSHAWMELDGKVYDVLFARAKDYKKYYALSYSGYNCHAVDKRKI